jgi:hypothetical protein
MIRTKKFSEKVKPMSQCGSDLHVGKDFSLTRVNPTRLTRSVSEKLKVTDKDKNVVFDSHDIITEHSK